MPRLHKAGVGSVQQHAPRPGAGRHQARIHHLQVTHIAVPIIVTAHWTLSPWLWRHTKHRFIQIESFRCRWRLSSQVFNERWGRSVYSQLVKRIIAMWNKSNISWYSFSSCHIFPFQLGIGDGFYKRHNFCLISWPNPKAGHVPVAVIVSEWDKGLMARRGPDAMQ